MDIDKRKEAIVVGVATRDDALAIHDLLCALSAVLNRPEGMKSTAEDIARYGFGATPAFETIIARRDGKPAGLAIYFHEFSTWRGCPGVYVQDLYVTDELRGMGLGRRLLVAVAARATTYNAAYMRLSVDTGNEHGMGFYERLGFVAPNEHILVLEGDALESLSRSEHR
jgi:GNAT superfamily N-acetyltransferase